jgi:hypothetical protein
LRKTTVSESAKLPGWESRKTLVSVTAYHSFSGEVEASNTSTIRRLIPSCRHQLSSIALDDTSAMTEFEAFEARSGYRVRLADGKWHDVPNSALIDPKTNKLGYAVVWLLPYELRIQCFLPGSGG